MSEENQMTFFQQNTHEKQTGLLYLPVFLPFLFRISLAAVLNRLRFLLIGKIETNLACLRKHTLKMLYIHSRQTITINQNLDDSEELFNQVNPALINVNL